MSSRQKAAETRKRKRDEAAAIDGLLATMSTQENADQDFVIKNMKEKPELASFFAGIIRDGRYDKAKQKQSEAPSVAQAVDLGRPLGRGVKTFKRLGLTVMQALFAKIAGDDNNKKDILNNLLKKPDGKGGMTGISPDELGEVWHWLLDVNDSTPIPTKHANSGFTTPLVHALYLRYMDCGERLAPYLTNPAQAQGIGFWFHDRTGDSANRVCFRLGNKTLWVTLPFSAEQATAITDWKIESKHTFYASITAATKFFSMDLGEKLETDFGEEVTALPMFEPQQPFEYIHAFGNVDAAPTTPTSVGGRSSVSGGAPLASPTVMNALPPRIT